MYEILYVSQCRGKVLCNIFSQAASITYVTQYTWHAAPTLHPSLSPAWHHGRKHHDLTPRSVILSDVTLLSLHFSKQVMCCTQDCAHLKAHSFQAVVILSPSGGVQSIVVEVRPWLTYLVYTVQCPFTASRWGNRSHTTLGDKRGKYIQ